MSEPPLLVDGPATRATARAEPQTGDQESSGHTGLPGGRIGRGVLGGASACCLMVVAYHLAMVFLWNAPSNAASEAYREPMRAWIRPFFSQGWQLFAPNPWSANTDMKAKARVEDANGTQRETEWVDLTAQDLVRLNGDLIPGRGDNGIILQATDMYMGSHEIPSGERTDGDYSVLTEDYLYSIAARRLGPEVDGGRIVAVRVQLVTTLVPSAPWSGEGDRGAPTVTTLNWGETTPDAF